MNMYIYIYTHIASSIVIVVIIIMIIIIITYNHYYIIVVVILQLYRLKTYRVKIRTWLEGYQPFQTKQSNVYKSMTTP